MQEETPTIDLLFLQEIEQWQILWIFIDYSFENALFALAWRGGEIRLDDFKMMGAGGAAWVANAWSAVEPLLQGIITVAVCVYVVTRAWRSVFPKVGDDG